MLRGTSAKALKSFAGGIGLVSPSRETFTIREVSLLGQDPVISRQGAADGLLLNLRGPLHGEVVTVVEPCAEQHDNKDWQQHREPTLPMRVGRCHALDEHRQSPLSTHCGRFRVSYVSVMVIVAGEQFQDNAACLTCSHVLDGLPIYLVARDADGEWQFLCDKVHEAADARVIGLAEAVALDRRLATLPVLLRNESTSLPR